MAATGRLMIASEARMPGSVVEQLLALRPGLARFNQAHGLRTALLYTAGWFVQWHEGGMAALDQARAASGRHLGHANARVIHRSTGPGVLVEPVQIATLHGNERSFDMARRLHELEVDLELRGGASPLAIWQRLCGPAPMGQRNVVMVSETTESLEVAKALSERCNARLWYQRFAGPDSHHGEVGGACCDCGAGRLQALSRHGMTHEVVRLGLGRVHALLVVLPSRPRAAEVLARAAARFADELEGDPARWLVAPDDAVLRVAQALLGEGSRRAPGSTLVEAARSILRNS